MSSFAIIVLSFFTAKAILLAIVVGTTFLGQFSIPFYHPPIWPFGYDSSSSVFVYDGEMIVEKIIAALLRWDTVYFTALAERGNYVWEQEWAFGPGWPALIRFTTPCIPLIAVTDLDLNNYLPTTLDLYQRYVLTAVILSNVFHFLAQIPLYHLTRRMYPLNRSIAITTCILHSFTPAGVFLLSGYTESLFAFLSFSGMALFHKEYRFLPALLWSLAGSIRSNAVLWTGFFAWDGLNTVITWDNQNVGRLFGKLLYLGGCAVVSLVGFAWWQYSAWEQYCTSNPQQWCANRLPLIYSYVQSHYWYIHCSGLSDSGTSVS
jgi:GPI mannosyltransferase 2